MTLVDDLVAWAATAHAAAPLYATDLVVGPRFTAVGAASRPNGATLQSGGIAHNGAAETDPDFSPAAATDALAPLVLGRPLHELIAFLAAAGEKSGSVSAAPLWAMPPLRRVTPFGREAAPTAVKRGPTTRSVA